MTDRFAACLAETLRWEGGWSNHPKDRGGATMRGVIQRVYDGWRDSKALPRQSVRHIGDAELQDIYRTGYWNMVRGDDLPAGVDLAVFDFAVNSGPTRAVKHLQKTVGVTQDGHIGPATLAAVRRSEPLTICQQLMAARRAYLRGLSEYYVFGKGWENRCNGVEPVALAMAGQPATFDTVIAELEAPRPLPDADAQSATQGRAQAADPKPPWVTEVLLGTTGIASNVTGFSNAFTKIAAMPSPTVSSITLAFLSEPLVLTGIVTVTAAVTTWLWRRRVAANA